MAFAAGEAHACDLCGCFTPQIEAMPEPELSALGQTAPVNVAHGGWQSHVYAAVAEHEWQQFMGVVTEWEIARYFEQS